MTAQRITTQYPITPSEILRIIFSQRDSCWSMLRCPDQSGWKLFNNVNYHLFIKGNFVAFDAGFYVCNLKKNTNETD